MDMLKKIGGNMKIGNSPKSSEQDWRSAEEANLWDSMGWSNKDAIKFEGWGAPQGIAQWCSIA